MNSKYDMNDIVVNNLTRAFYPSDKNLIIERGMYVNNRENKEYTLYIDSKDRDYDKYKNPFNFSVDFGSTITQSVTKGINFPYKIDELNYIYIKTVYLPVRLLYEYFQTKTRPILYFIIRIKELNFTYHFFSNQNFNSQTDVLLYPIGNQGDFLNLDSKIVINFKDNVKPVVNRLTFEFLHSTGEPILVPTKLRLDDGIEKNTVLLDYSNPNIIDGDTPQLQNNNVLMEIKLGINEKQNLT